MIIGGVAPVTAFLFEPNGAASAYADVESPMAQTWPASTACSTNWSHKRAAGKGLPPRRGRNDVLQLADADKKRACITQTEISTPPKPWPRSPHEYTAVQGGEGDAPVAYGGRRGALSASSRTRCRTRMGTQCMREGNGMGGRISNTRTYYAARTPSTASPREKIGVDTCGTGDTDELKPEAQMKLISTTTPARSRSRGPLTRPGRHPSSSGRDLRRRLLGRLPHAIRLRRLPPDCPADEGWKKAFAEFTGHADITAFYDEFDAWAKTASATTSSRSSSPTPTSASLSTFAIRRRISSQRFSPGARGYRQRAPDAVKLVARTIAAILATAAVMQ